MQQRIVALILNLILISPAFADEPATQHLTIQEAAHEKVQQLTQTLKMQLQTAVKEGGIVKGIEACSLQAQDISKRLNTDNWEVKRTSLKVRNPLNRPLQEEASVLEAFEGAKLTGKSIKELSYYEVEDKGSHRIHHYMQAIPTQAMCLSCHGETLTEDVKAALLTRYPDDQAIGFKEGDIRGAFSVRFIEQKR